jgi:hypothetical protein
MRILIDDLGDWGDATLVSEYDPCGPSIRINARALARLCKNDPPARAMLIERAIAHELYHHREAIGQIARIPDRASREAAARTA